MCDYNNTLHCLVCRRLNEGHTVFIERKIAGRMANEQLRQFVANGGWNDLQEQVSVMTLTFTSRMKVGLSSPSEI